MLGLPTTVSHGTESGDTSEGGTPGGDAAWEYFKQDAKRQGVSLNQYLSEAGIIKPKQFDSFYQREQTIDPALFQFIVDYKADLIEYAYEDSLDVLEDEDG